MLNKLKNKDKTKKQTKKGTSTKNDPKQQTKDEEQTQQQEQNTDLVDVSQLKKEQKTKTKVVHINRTPQYELKQKEVDLTSIDQATKSKGQKPKQMKKWGTSTLQEVMRKDFKADEISHQFMSLTDQQLNKKIQQQRKQQIQKQKNIPVKEQGNLKVADFQKSKDQLAMERAEGAFQFAPRKQNTGFSSGISTSGQAIMFSNSSLNNQNFKPIQKSAQELKFEEAERKQQQIEAKKPTSWMGTKKNNQTTPSDAATTQAKLTFKTSKWVPTTDIQTDVAAGQAIKFAPLNLDDKTNIDRRQQPKKQQFKKQQPKKQQPKKQTGGWATNSIQVQSNGLKFAPLQMSAQQQKFQQAGRRQQQQFVCVSKKQMQQRKRKREQKQKELKAKQQPK